MSTAGESGKQAAPAAAAGAGGAFGAGAGAGAGAVWRTTFRASTRLTSTWLARLPSSSSCMRPAMLETV